MKHIVLPAIAATLALSACATPAYVSPVEVTRFVGNTPTTLGQGTVSIAPASGLDGNALEYGIYADALRAELESLGYRVVAQGGTQTAVLGIEQYVAENSRGRGGGVGVGAGGSTGSYGSGVGVGVGIDLTRLINGAPPDSIVREVSVALRPADGGMNLWEGRAAMSATENSDYAADAAAASRIVDAMFEDFPGISGETIQVD